RLGTTGSASFEFDWTPPPTRVGTITMYAVGNAANGNGSNSGDHIYSANVQLTAATVDSRPSPTITSSNGVVNAASFQAPIGPNTWVTIAGNNLATSTRVWNSTDIAGGVLPTSLDGVSVTINGKPAYIEYISPTQINVLASADTSTGPVNVQVFLNGK